MKAGRLQKPIAPCALALFLLLSLFLQQSFGALKCYNWYFKKNEEHKQPPLDSEFWMIDQYETYYLDRSANDTDRVLYLTFDAGYENGNVEKVVDALNAQGVPGAFFVLSHLAKANAPLLQKMAQSGHTVCNHTANHKDMTKCEDAQAFAAELDALRQDCAAIGVPVANTIPREPFSSVRYWHFNSMSVHFFAPFAVIPDTLLILEKMAIFL